MPNIEVNGEVIAFPDNLSPDDLNAAVASAAGGTSNEKPTYDRGFFKNYKGGAKTLPQKADVVGGGVADFIMNAVKSPYDAVGEIVTAPIEQRPMRAPSLFGGQNPADPLATINKLLRAGVSGAATGNMDTARAAYNAPRGAMGAVEDTTLGLLLSQVAPEVAAAPMDAATGLVSKTASAVKSGVSSAVKKGIRVALGPTEEAQQALFNRPQDVARQTDFVGLGDKLASTVNSLQEKVGELDSQAWDTLLKLKAEPQSKLVSILKNVKQQFIGTGKTKVGDADRAAAAQIDKYIERVKAIKQPGATPGTEQMLDQPQIKDIIQSIQKDATYGLVKNEPVNRAVKAARAGIDTYLKGENPVYADAMQPVADATSALEDAVKTFKLDRHPDLGYVPTKTTVDRLAAISKGKNPQLQRTVDALKNVTGVDLADEANLTAIKQQFEKGMKANGSRRANMGAGVGAGTGVAISRLLGMPAWAGATTGGAVGSLAGGAADIYGGPMAASVIDTLRNANSGVGELLSAINNKARGTPIEDVVKRLIAGEPALAPLLRGNR